MLSVRTPAVMMRRVTGPGLRRTTRTIGVRPPLPSHPPVQYAVTCGAARRVDEEPF